MGRRILVELAQLVMEDISGGNIAAANMGAVFTTADPATHHKAVWKVFQIPDG